MVSSGREDEGGSRLQARKAGGEVLYLGLIGAQWIATKGTHIEDCRSRSSVISCELLALEHLPCAPLCIP